MHRLPCDLAQDTCYQSWSPLEYPKRLRSSPSLLNAPSYISLEGWVKLIPLFALHLGQSGEPMSHLGYNSLDKIAGTIFITKNRTESFSDHRSAFTLLILPKPLTFLRCLLVRIDCTARKLMPTSLALIRRSRLLSHITRVCTTLTFSSAMASLGRPDGPSSQTFSFCVLK